VSSRHTRSFFGVMLAVVFALSAVVVAPASAKLTKHQKAHVRKQLKRAIKKNPRLIKSKRFIKKASLVDFSLPVTIKLRPKHFANSTANPNKAGIDLGASLGQRDIGLGGVIKAHIQFHDSFDGGALGNVDLTLDPGGSVTTTAIPLLWNSQVSAPSTHWYNAGLAGAGCNDFVGDQNNLHAGTLDSLYGLAGGVATALGAPAPSYGGGIPWFADDTTAHSFHTAAAATDPKPAGLPSPPFPPFGPYGLVSALISGASPSPGGFVAERPGVDGLENIINSDQPGDNNVGSSANPFPTSLAYPGGVTRPGVPVGETAPTYKDAVLRTGSISLGVTAPGTAINQSDNPDGAVSGAIDKVAGKSGGQANLFGNIPGKSYGVDVEVTLDGMINSILRQVDSDPADLIDGENFPAAAFECRQAWTGAVHNYISGVHLVGSLKISPAIMSDGRLRIAKTVLSQKGDTTIALAACLAPYTTVSNDTTDGDPLTDDFIKVPNDPLNTTASKPAPTVPCNTEPDTIVREANVHALVPPSVGESDGSQVTVTGTLQNTAIDADVLIGQ
jgi:hypothetical protein